MALCAFGALAGTAMANKHKAHMVFGKFKANYPNGRAISPTSPTTAKGTGEMS